MPRIRSRTNSVVDIRRGTEQGDGYGGVAVVRATVQADWKCFLHSFLPFFSETLYATELGKSHSAFDYKAHGAPPEDIDVVEGDFLVVTSASYDVPVGATFEVISVYACRDRSRVHHVALSIRREHA